MPLWRGENDQLNSETAPSPNSWDMCRPLVVLLKQWLKKLSIPKINTHLLSHILAAMMIDLLHLKKTSQVLRMLHTIGPAVMQRHGRGPVNSGVNSSQVSQLHSLFVRESPPTSPRNQVGTNYPQIPAPAAHQKYTRERLTYLTCSFNLLASPTDLYSRVLTNQTKITNEGMQLTAIEQWAMKCPRCFGPQENEIKAHQDEPDIIIAMDGNFQQRHYAYASKDNPPESKYPSSFIPPSKIAPNATLFTSTEAAAVGIDLEYAHSVYIDLIAALEKLHQEPNRHTPGSNYTNSFFEQQWRDEQAYHVTTNQSSERAQVELGRLLCMEEELNDAWSAIAMTPEQALTRARSCATLARKLEAQRRLAPPNSENSNLTASNQDKLSKVWFAKTELRRSFLALVEEKQPLLCVCRAGEATTLGKFAHRPSVFTENHSKFNSGTQGQQKLSEALRKRVAQLRTTLNDYNRLARSFIQSNPTHAAPPIIDYSALLALQPDDTFWNDGLFTNANEAWAVDPLTQRGIRALACRNRALEEKRRLAWEVRRTARWAVQHHSHLLSLLTLLVHYQDEYDQQTEPVPIPPPLVPLVNHFLLQSNEFDIYNICAVELLIHQAYVEVCTLQLDWNDKLIKVFQRTMSQDGDKNLLSTWNKQVLRIKHAITNNLLSGIPGDCADLVPFMNQNNHLDLLLPLNENGPDEDDNEQEYFENMEHILSETMRANLFHEAAETPVSVDEETDHQSGTINPYAHAP
ncbi:hypothetical protein PtB15_12B63 [Puccinia triticina]|nr:hypothetical protein PtB15_12B63 [Puccinia triticina]